CLDGRVKTLHPNVHAGILADTRNPDHVAQLADLGIEPFDLVVSNLYPFTDTVMSGASPDECIEQIDIGGPSMVRAAAKNHASVAIVTDPAEYPSVLMVVRGGGFSLEQRRTLAAQAFAHTATYDVAVASWMGNVLTDTSDGTGFPAWTGATWDKKTVLRYGENPHQRAALYTHWRAGLANAEQLHGKEMSYNNYVDADAAQRAASDHAEPAVAIIKHANPCGIAVGDDIAMAHRRAHACDPVSAYGGVVATNRPVTAELAAQAFVHTATYDVAVASWMGNVLTDSSDGTGFPAWTGATWDKKTVLRYGENPHQRAALYTHWRAGLANAEQLHGKEMSYNNYVDADAAWRAAHDHDAACVAIIKHANPCGIAVSAAGDVADAHRRAHACDAVSAYGAVIACNREVTVELAAQISKVFTEVVLAPSYAEGALDVLARKKNVRLLLASPPQRGGVEFRALSGGLLLQTRDALDAPGDDPATWTLATGSPVDGATMADLAFAWRACRAVRSNAILLAADAATVGIGMGQVNRVDAARLAVSRAGERAAGAVAVSDAFFPFPDGLEVLLDAGVRAVAHPGGSIRDAEVTAAAEAAGVPLYLTGTRHFTH
ncbi:MAG TPA: bifunctional phosphoribosylaminoimidazolecarboxamide formyltransferase/IMP cyclohydrolase, partial [Pseudonocardiaceae bacterium]|nr:bifunctional phosphoribosylaminoimidazolecarboxamide formyltransferase/IMP cyclohydrolase [Pseudonocardiaceae bacterium]